jgi:hypothetical protein
MNCYLCGKEIIKKFNMEKDHVPPDCIFPDNEKPANLITVKCCTSCHDAFDTIDEKMRNHIAILAGNKSGTVGKRAMRVLLRNPKLLKVFVSQTQIEQIPREDIHSNRLRYFFSDDELERWLIRIVKGLYFHRFKKLIENGLDYCVKKLPELIPPSSMTFQMEEGLEMRPYFVYGIDKTPELDYWLLIFYDRIAFSVTITKPY